MWGHIKSILSKEPSSSSKEPQEGISTTIISIIDHFYELSAFIYQGKLVLYKPILEHKIGYYSHLELAEKALRQFIAYQEEYNQGTLYDEQENTYYFLVSKFNLDSFEDYILSQNIYTAEGELYDRADQGEKDNEPRFKQDDFVQFIKNGKLQVGKVVAPEIRSVGIKQLFEQSKNQLGDHIYPVRTEHGILYLPQFRLSSVSVLDIRQ